MKITLLHPPLDDPTIPYHSTAYLAGHLADNGFNEVSMRDLNIEFVNWCLEERVFDRFQEEVARHLRELESRPNLTFAEQDAYFGFWAPPDITFRDIQKAVKGLRSFDAFFDFAEYKDNSNILLRYFGLLGALSFPSEVTNFRPTSRGRYSFYHLRDLLDEALMGRICHPFARFLDEKLAGDEGLRESDCIGISVVYDHQLSHSLYLARRLKNLMPDKQVLFGGTSVSQMYKYLKDQGQLRRFFSFCDGLVVGEGETALLQIAEAGGVSPGMEARNLITYDRARDRLHLPPFIHYENVTQLGRPRYDHPWDLYLSPARGINYAPTRGCYWNRCTFCDYGLNTDKPTSPWRERKVEQVVEDLSHATARDGVRYVYFAVDVMSPKYLDRLTDAIAESGLDIRWSAELRLEKVFSAKRCRKMADSGCICISFGMESGSQRVLDLIDKGTQVHHMGRTMKNFSEAGIAVQLMAFTGFPTETEEEKRQTVQFVEEHDPYWSAGGLGKFLLTGTAIVARDPGKFGVELVETEGADIARAIAWKRSEVDEDTPEDTIQAMLTEDADASFDSDGGLFPGVFSRPWAGGTDSLHTMLYYEKHGPKFFRENPVEERLLAEGTGDDTLLSSKLFLPGQLRESVFDVAAMVRNRQAYSERLRELSEIPREPTWDGYQQWSSGKPVLARNADSKPSYWICSRDKTARLDELLFRLLKIGLKHDIPVHQLVGGLRAEMRGRVLDFLRRLGEQGLLEFNPPTRGGAAIEGMKPALAGGLAARSAPSSSETVAEGRA